MLKKCFKCGLVKPIEEFYKHKETADGHLNKCKMCTKSDVRKNRRDKKEYYKEYYDNKVINYEVRSAYTKQYRKINSAKYKAHTILNNSKRKGLIIVKPCEICGCIERVEAHHDDYSKPLDVIWLCALHHHWIHS